MKKTKLYIIIFFAVILSIRAVCEDEELNKKPPYYFKCFVNGAFREYLINQASYSPTSNLTTIEGTCELYGELKLVWEGQKITSGMINVSEANNLNRKQFIFLKESPTAIDTFIGLNFDYQILKYDDVGGKISGEFKSIIKADSLGKMITKTVKPATDSTVAIMKDTIIYEKVPEFILEVSKGEFSIYRSADI